MAASGCHNFNWLSMRMFYYISMTWAIRIGILLAYDLKCFVFSCFMYIVHAANGKAAFLLCAQSKALGLTVQWISIGRYKVYRMSMAVRVMARHSSPGKVPYGGVTRNHNRPSGILLWASGVKTKRMLLLHKGSN